MRQAWVLIAVAATAVPFEAVAQDRPTRWQRRGEAVEVPVTVFHSTQAANLPTAETLRKGEWLFEISHRFFPAVSEGADALWGFDGPVNNRLGLAYAVHDRAMIGVVRTNLQDNLELNAKIRVAESRGSVPIMLALMGGVAWNTELPDIPSFEGNETQAYAQLIVNAAIGDRLAVGAVPTVLRNPRIEDADPETALALGLNAQVYLSAQASLLGEWVVSEERSGQEHDSGTLGLELETGGHFFKIVLSNQVRMNPTQFLGGSAFNFEPDEWRVGFNITRLLSF